MQFLRTCLSLVPFCLPFWQKSIFIFQLECIKVVRNLLKETKLEKSWHLWMTVKGRRWDALPQEHQYSGKQGPVLSKKEETKQPWYPYPEQQDMKRLYCIFPWKGSRLSEYNSYFWYSYCPISPMRKQCQRSHNWTSKSFSHLKMPPDRL